MPSKHSARYFSAKGTPPFQTPAMGFAVSGNFSALLTEPIEIGAQWVLRKVLLPQTRREEMDLKGGMGIDALQHIDQGDVGIHPLESAGRNQALHDADVARPDFGPAEQPIPAAERDRSNLAFQMIGVERDIRILQKHAQRLLPLQGVACGFGKRVRW